MNTQNKEKELKAKAQKLATTIQIGKKGLTEETVKELKQQLRKRKMVKIKMLKSFLETTPKKEAVAEIEKATQSKAMQVIGFTAVFYKT